LTYYERKKITLKSSAQKFELKWSFKIICDTPFFNKL